jgi:hypothetical protein
MTSDRPSGYTEDASFIPPAPSALNESHGYSEDKIVVALTDCNYLVIGRLNPIEQTIEDPCLIKRPPAQHNTSVDTDSLKIVLQAIFSPLPVKKAKISLQKVVCTGDPSSELADIYRKHSSSLILPRQKITI